MIKVENVEVLGWEAAIRGMRNPKNSWQKSDSGLCLTHGPDHCSDCVYADAGCNGYEADLNTRYIIGSNDQKLMMTLRNAGTDHRKFMRMITVYLDITAPLYWWKEFDTYKVGTVANSCSTMHKIHAKEFTLDDFSCEHLVDELDFERTFKTYLCITIDGLNEARNEYLETGDKFYWWQMIQLLPSSYNQRRTVLLNYEVLANMYKSRKNHKLDEWRTLCEWMKTLPYSELITGEKAESAT